MIPFPLIFEDEPELRRFIRDIFIEATKDPDSDLPVLLSIRECCKTKGVNYYMVKAALKNGELKYSTLGGKTGIKRADFLSWINNETPERRFPETKIRRTKF